MSAADKTVVDFFAGIGLVRYALARRGWKEVFALDHSAQKHAMYAHHFGDDVYCVEDIHHIHASNIPCATLAHASFPCTNTSVAGGREGLAGSESSALWEWIRVLEEHGDDMPRLVLLENVEGFLSSNKQQDLLAVLKRLNTLGYSLDLMLINAVHFVPQSRVRLFVVGIRHVRPHNGLELDHILYQRTQARPKRITAFIQMHADINWRLSVLPQLPERTLSLESILDCDEQWWNTARTTYLFNQMHNHHQVKLLAFMQQEAWTYGTAFRRMRIRDDKKQSTAEVRFDGIAGCLRTPKGGSARQIVVRAGFGQLDARLFTARECARLMGAGDYRLASDVSLHNALFGFGDAVCVPAIEWISQHCLEPLYAQFIEPSQASAVLARSNQAKVFAESSVHLLSA